MDPLELIHFHLAEEAPPVHAANPGIPLMISKIVAKLILKQPEKRYQSGSGLLADLIKCREEYEKYHSVAEFPLGTRDRTHRITFVSKMVGRDKESRVILETYQRSARGEFPCLFISGLSGIGKTRLIQELQRPIISNRGYFTSGKFDVYQKNIPYSSLIQAFRNLVRTFLTESDERVANWKKKILAAVGQNGHVVTEVVPELEILIGPQPPVHPLPPVEARNRFQDVFGRFLSSLANEENPLVLFIDDLQWCDTASFDFLASIFADPRAHPHLLFLGAYRHNEVDEAHPLTKLLRALKEQQYPLKEIRLDPLKAAHCHEMVSYILDSPLEETADLAGFIADLSEGNPLFVSESLSFLYNENLLSFDEQSRQWKWDIEKIKSANMPSSVVVLFSSKVGRLPIHTIRLLEYGACMGNLFPPDDLALIQGISLLRTFESLKPALSQGLLMESKDQLQFVHDKVQEAVLSTIQPPRRRQIHAEIGKHLLERIPTGTDLESLENLFTIVSHLNLGKKAPLDPATAYRLSDINYHAGNKALESLATEAAKGYFQESLKLLPESAWSDQYEQTFKIYQKAAKTELMAGNYETSERLLNQLLERARTDLDKAEALAEQTTSLSSIGNFIKAIETANRGLAFFDKAIPDDPGLAAKKRDRIMAEINANYPDVWSQILHMPFTLERKSKIELAFYAELIPDLYMSGLVPQLYLSAVQSTKHCLEGGMDESVIYSFSIMGLFLGEQEQFEQAFQYEDLAKNLSAKYPNTFGATRGMNGVVWCNMHSRSRPSEIVEYCLKAIQSGRNCGDLYNAGLSYGPLMWNLQVQGSDLREIEAYAKECFEFSRKYQLLFSIGLSEAVQAGWVEPMKKDYRPIPMKEKIRKWSEVNHIASAGSYYVLLGISDFYFHDHRGAERSLQEVNQYLNGLTDNVLKRQWYIFRAMNALRLHAVGQGYDTLEQLRSYIDPIIAKVETWAGLGPLLKPYLALLRAEQQRVTGSFREAREKYWDTLDAARTANYIFLEAFAHESFADYLEENGSPLAGLHRRESIRLFRQCHADRKEFLLLERFPELAAEAAPRSAAEPETLVSEYTLPNLDIQYLMKSALAISAEIDTVALQRKIMNVILEISGAQHGYLVLNEDGVLMIRAESHAADKSQVNLTRRRLEECEDICKSLVRFVQRTKETINLRNASEEGSFKDNPEIQSLKLRSVYCLPLLERSRLIGVLYLENRLATDVFTEKRAEMTQLLVSQAAISLENARLVDEMKSAESQIKQSLWEKEVLLREIHHRVKNNLQVVSSLFSLQSRYVKDSHLLEILKETQNRVRSMAFVHEKLHESKDQAGLDFSGYVRLLTGNLFRSYGVSPNKVTLTTQIPSQPISIEMAAPMGLILNELTSNALKHAFAPDSPGQILIRLKINREFVLTVADNGTGIPEGFDIRNTKTLGLQLVLALTEQLKGTIELIRNQGTKFIIRWPNPALAQSGKASEARK